ncbi:MAG: formyltetrahydrofolate deformylase [Burkholderiaceae bacterium]|jgi:formyltetrahydrofolate deformylase
MPSEYILTLTCPDRKGVVHTISGILLQHEGNIIDSSQFGDENTGLFFLRIHFSLETPEDLPKLKASLHTLESSMGMQWTIAACEKKMRVLIAVSRLGHCLNDLLFRWENNLLPIEVCAVFSNHEQLKPMTSQRSVPFFHHPVSEDNRNAQEKALLKLIEELDIELVVLARYMQVLSPAICDALSGRVINIHHSFLPSFKGAQPYKQAHERGVKLIGATAHYVTNQLDEGPIIEQDVERVSHALSPSELSQMGADIESRVLARAVKWHAEHRILLNGSKTVVFP